MSKTLIRGITAAQAGWVVDFRGDTESESFSLPVVCWAIIEEGDVSGFSPSPIYHSVVGLVPVNEEGSLEDPTDYASFDGMRFIGEGQE